MREFYKRHPMDLAIQYVANSESLTEEDKERLAWEGGIGERKILENSPRISKEDSILKAISDRLYITITDSSTIRL